ncbi:hypothetical protein HK405_015041, partial [Cladochytrium tenue]
MRTTLAALGIAAAHTLAPLLQLLLLLNSQAGVVGAPEGLGSNGGSGGLVNPGPVKIRSGLPLNFAVTANLKNYGGPTVPNVEVFPIFYGAALYKNELLDFYKAVVNASYMDISIVTPSSKSTSPTASSSSSPAYTATPASSPSTSSKSSATFA